ncbi:MAG: SMI1/KNR4 family protein [Lachnospiraceae bacterium]|nr:SMI1/KNR4 family protein [Lachnospiraceae bacterium]
MRVPENNSLKAEIEEILKLCKESEEEYGDKASYFNEPVSEQEMTEWEEANGVKIPESYKEWLRFTGKCEIVSNTATFWGPKEFNSDYVPEDLVVIGEMIGDGEMVCFSKESGEFVRFFEGHENGTYKVFNDVLKVIIRTKKVDGGLSDDAKILFMKLVLENRKKKDGENE